jgi:hypothetical protein
MTHLMSLDLLNLSELNIENSISQCRQKTNVFLRQILEFSEKFFVLFWNL